MTRRHVFAGALIALICVAAVEIPKITRGAPQALRVEPEKILGDPNAPNTLVVFSDFGCGYCMMVDPRLKEVLKAFPGQLKLVYKHFPLKSHPKRVLWAAEASECAADQHRFWDYHDALYGDFERWTNAPVKDVKGLFYGYAQKTGLDLERYKQCYDSHVKASVVWANKREGENYLVSGTPTCILNGYKILRNNDTEKMIAAVRAEIDKRRGA